MKLFLDGACVAALLLANVSAQKTTQAPALSLPSVASNAWGEPVEGIQLRLAVSKKAPPQRPGELPLLELQLRNVGNEAVTFTPFYVGCGTDLEIDGVLYPPGPSAGSSPPALALIPGGQSAIMPLRFLVDGHETSSKTFNLTPGRHTVRARNYGGVFHSPTRRLTGPLFSNVIAVEVVVGAQSVSGSLPSPLMSSDEIAHQVQRQLDSADPREVAWGAYNASAYQVMSAIPFLERTLEGAPTTTDHERLALVDTVLDALIQLHADVPASGAFPYFDLRPVQTLVLLTMSADRDPTLLQLLTTTSGSPWYSAANILLREKAPGLAPHLLATLTLRVTVIVLDSDPPPGHGSGSSISSGGPYPQIPAGYPPHARYEFAMTPGPGLIVLAAGPRTVYYSRTITKDIPDTLHDLGLSAPTDADRTEYLQAMLGPGDQTKLQAETYLSIRWSTPEALIQQVAKMRGDIERQYQLLLGVLVRDGRLTSGEAAALPSPIAIQLIDRRKDQSVPLPSIRR